MLPHCFLSLLSLQSLNECAAHSRVPTPDSCYLPAPLPSISQSHSDTALTFSLPVKGVKALRTQRVKLNKTALLFLFTTLFGINAYVGQN